MGVTGLSVVEYFALNRMADGVERGVVIDVRPREELCYTLYSSIPTNQPPVANIIEAQKNVELRHVCTCCKSYSA